MTIELKVSTAMVMAMAMVTAMAPTVMGTMKTVNKKRSLVK